MCHSDKGEERSEDLKEDTEMIGEFVYGLMQTEGDILPTILRVALGIVTFLHGAQNHNPESVDFDKALEPLLPFEGGSLSGPTE